MPRKATVRAGESGARYLQLPRAAFDTIADKCAPILEQRKTLYEADLLAQQQAEQAAAQPSSFLARAVAAFNAEQEGDLGFAAGEVIVVSECRFLLP